MRAAFLALLLLAGCAAHRENGSPFSGATQDAEDREFFYGHIWKAEPSQDDAEDRKFFYGR